MLIGLSPNIKLMWVPGHAGITGNEYADKAAKLALKSCLHLYMPFGPRSIKNIHSNALKSNFINDWSNYQHQYKEINRHGLGILLPPNTSTWMNKCFVRLRLGHSLLTHEHLLKSTRQPSCMFCNISVLTINHILLHCPALLSARDQCFEDKNPIDLLSNPTENNVKTICSFLKTLILHI